MRKGQTENLLSLAKVVDAFRRPEGGRKVVLIAPRDAGQRAPPDQDFQTATAPDGAAELCGNMLPRIRITRSDDDYFPMPLPGMKQFRETQ